MRLGQNLQWFLKHCTLLRILRCLLGFVLISVIIKSRNPEGTDKYEENHHHHHRNLCKPVESLYTAAINEAYWVQLHFFFFSNEKNICKKASHNFAVFLLIFSFFKQEFSYSSQQLAMKSCNKAFTYHCTHYTVWKCVCLLVCVCVYVSIDGPDSCCYEVLIGC